MRTSLNEIKEIEDYLFHFLPKDESLLFEAKLILYPELKQEVAEQKKVYKLVQAYHRKKLKEEIETIHQVLFSEPKYKSFAQKVLNLFFKS